MFATQSTHKLLAALSQSAMLHVRSADRAPVDHDRLNETYLMHCSTSPLYPMIASLDVAAAMMDGPAGPYLTGEAVIEAVRFRQAMVRLAARIREDGRAAGLVLRRLAAHACHRPRTPACACPSPTPTPSC